jgi:hypothetical protein
MQTEKQRERLVELLKKADANPFNREITNFEDIMEMIADYLMSNNVVVLPCNVNDTVWYIDQKYNIQEAEVSCIDIRGYTNKHIIAKRYDYEKEDTITVVFFFEDLNDSFWLSREEAENVLKERCE